MPAVSASAVTQLGLGGWPGRRYGSFAGKATIVLPTFTYEATYQVTKTYTATWQVTNTYTSTSQVTLTYESEWD